MIGTDTRAQPLTACLAALADIELARLVRRLRDPQVRTGPPRLVAFHEGVERCAKVEQLIRRGGRADLRDAAGQALRARALALDVPERLALLLALCAQARRMPPGPLRAVAEALAAILYQAGVAAEARGWEMAR